MLDIALDSWFRVCVERMEKSKLSGDDLIELVALVLDNASIAVCVLEGCGGGCCSAVCVLCMLVCVCWGVW